VRGLLEFRLKFFNIHAIFYFRIKKMLGEVRLVEVRLVEVRLVEVRLVEVRLV
jgi:hypothetical protein